MDISIVRNSTDYPKWIMTPVKECNLSHDIRFLIPFMTKFHKIGMINHNGEVVIKPEYDVICNDIYSESDLLVVGQLYPYGFVNDNNNVDARVRCHYGVLMTDGGKLLDVKYRLVLLGINSDRITTEAESGDFCVFDKKGETIVPYKTYKKIDGFDNNLARVIDYNDKWGVINEKGEEVVPLIYDNIWNFYGRNRTSTKTVKNGIERDIQLCELNRHFPYQNDNRR